MALSAVYIQKGKMHCTAWVRQAAAPSLIVTEMFLYFVIGTGRMLPSRHHDDSVYGPD